MRILAVPDLHAWPTADARPGEPNRREEWLSVTDYLVRLAQAEQVSLVVAPGDFFVNSRPSAQAVIDVKRFFTILEEKLKIPVVGISGNHDSAGSQPGPVDVLAELAKDRWGTTHLAEYWLDFSEGKTIQVIAMPWLPPGRLAGMYGGLQGMLDKAREMAERGRGQARYSILVGHWAIKGCVTSNGVRIIDQEPVLELEELYRLPVDAVILGHIHKPQVFDGPFPILHTGALLRNSFVEEHDERKVAIVDLETKEIAWHPIPARRYFTWRLAEEELKTGRFACPPEAKDAICRVVYAATEEVHKQVDQARLAAMVKEAGAWHFAGIYPEIIHSHRVRARQMTEQASQADALQQWLDLQPGLTKELKDAVLQEAKALSIIPS